MIRQKITLTNKLGLHARASMKLSQVAARYQSEVFLFYKDRRADGKNILDVMVLAAPRGAEIEITVSGIDEKESFDALSKIIHDKFGEQE